MTVRVAVVGGGVTGLTAALRILQQIPESSVTLMEADQRIGGKIASSPFAGVAAVDEGADAFLTRSPAALGLARELGLDSTLTAPAVGGASVWWNGLHPIPEGLMLGLPTGMRTLARSGLLSWRGKLRAGLEPLLPATGVGADSVGRLVRKRFGNQVHERLVDPLVGSIYAADTDRFSLAGVPQIAQLATHRSLLIAGRAARAKAPRPQPGTAPSPIFATPVAGMAALTDAIGREVARRGGDIRLGATVTSLRRGDVGRGRWVVNGEELFDAVVLASPAKTTAPLVADVSAEAAGLLAASDHAGVVMVTLAVPDWPERLRHSSGYLVPKPVQHWVTAVSFASAKWSHWQPTDGTFVLRVSLGRDGRELTGESDDALMTAAVDEVGRHTGVDLQPTSIRIRRWPLAFPQYRPGHAATVDAIERALQRDAAGVFVAGASYRGIGIPACIQHAHDVAQAVVEFAAAVGD